MNDSEWVRAGGSCVCDGGERERRRGEYSQQVILSNCHLSTIIALCKSSDSLGSDYGNEASWPKNHPLVFLFLRVYVERGVQ